jgi:hypothetical protein
MDAKMPWLGQPKAKKEEKETWGVEMIDTPSSIQWTIESNSDQNVFRDDREMLMKG